MLGVEHHGLIAGPFAVSQKLPKTVGMEVNNPPDGFLAVRNEGARNYRFTGIKLTSSAKEVTKQTHAGNAIRRAAGGNGTYARDSLRHEP